MIRYDKILVPTDLTTESFRAAEHAVKTAERGATVELLHVNVQPMPAPAGPMVPTVGLTGSAPLQKELEQIIERLRPMNPDVEIRARVELGHPGTVVIDQTKRFDLVVMAAKDRGRLSRFLLGSVADEVVRGAHCPVLIIR